MKHANIPGFYFDEVKKKYFRIQPNHVTASGASKYTKDHVNHERQQAKKRKIEHADRDKRRRQTVSRALEPHRGTHCLNFGRELGYSESVTVGHNRDEAFVRHLRPSSLDVSYTDGREVRPIHAIRSSGESEYLLAVESRCLHANMICNAARHRGGLQVTPLPHAPFMSRITSLTAAPSSDHVVREGFLATALEPEPRGNVMIGHMCENHHSMHLARMAIGGAEESLWTSGFSSSMRHAAFGGSEALYLIDLAACATSILADRIECRALDWLNEQTIAAGQCTSDRKTSVMLCDVRSQGASSRFCTSETMPKGRRGLPILTGIARANDSENQLLVATNYAINLFDTRMIGGRDRPLVSLHHEHNGPQLSFATNGRGLIAASNTLNHVVVYSTTTGRAISTLPALRENSLSGARAMGIQSLAFDEDPCGVPLIRACQGDKLVSWCWNNDRDDE